MRNDTELLIDIFLSKVKKKYSLMCSGIENHSIEENDTFAGMLNHQTVVSAALVPVQA